MHAQIGIPPASRSVRKTIAGIQLDSRAKLISYEAQREQNSCATSREEQPEVSQLTFEMQGTLQVQSHLTLQIQAWLSRGRCGSSLAALHLCLFTRSRASSHAKGVAERHVARVSAADLALRVCLQYHHMCESVLNKIVLLSERVGAYVPDSTSMMICAEETQTQPRRNQTHKPPSRNCVVLQSQFLSFISPYQELQLDLEHVLVDPEPGSSIAYLSTGLRVARAWKHSLSQYRTARSRLAASVQSLCQYRTSRSRAHIMYLVAPYAPSVPGTRSTIWPVPNIWEADSGTAIRNTSTGSTAVGVYITVAAGTEGVVSLMEPVGPSGARSVPDSA
eukprot:3020498-Rhodomonas_salina.1